MVTLEHRVESWPLAEAFVISRGAKTAAEVVVVTLRDGGFEGRGECVPYARYGETIESVCAEIRDLAPAGEMPAPDREDHAVRLGAGAARNAIDCAMWDLEAARTGQPVHALAGTVRPEPLLTAYTVSLGEPDAMAQAARRASDYPLLKLKLGGGGDDKDRQRLNAVRAVRPEARLIVDGNEGCDAAGLVRFFAFAREMGVELIEQPLPAGADEVLGQIERPVPVCADESAHCADDVPALADRYDAVNIKLDKAGGLTGALAMRDAAEAHGMLVMVGCMVATSLAIAPALLVAERAAWVDLDGPLLLARDRVPGLRYAGSRVCLPDAPLWGSGQPFE